MAVNCGQGCGPLHHHLTPRAVPVFNCNNLNVSGCKAVPWVTVSLLYEYGLWGSIHDGVQMSIEQEEVYIRREGDLYVGLLC